MKVNTNAHRAEIGTTKRQRDRLAEQRAKQLIERVRAREEKTARMSEIKREHGGETKRQVKEQEGGETE